MLALQHSENLPQHPSIVAVRKLSHKNEIIHAKK